MRRNAMECGGMGSAAPCSSMRRHAVPGPTSDAGLGCPMPSPVVASHPMPPRAVACLSCSPMPHGLSIRAHSCPASALCCSPALPGVHPSLHFPGWIRRFGGWGEDRRRECRSPPEGRRLDGCGGAEVARECGSDGMRRIAMEWEALPHAVPYKAMQFHAPRPMQVWAGQSCPMPSRVVASRHIPPYAIACNSMLCRAPRADHSCPVLPRQWSVLLSGAPCR
jgi:hypothetical protein